MNNVRSLDDFESVGNLDYQNLCVLKDMFMTKVPLYIVDDAYVNSKYINKQKRKQTIKQTDMPKSTIDPLLDEEHKDTTYDEMEDIIDENNLCKYDLRFDHFDIFDIENDVMLYFHIPAFKSTAEKKAEIYYKVTELDVLDKTHHKKIIERLNSNKDYSTIIKNVFQITYCHINDIIKLTLNERLYEKLHEAG